MSTDPAGLEGSCIGVINRKYIKFSVSREDWCNYEGDCKLYDTSVYPPEELCVLCEYRSLLKIPEIIENLRKRQEKKDESN